VAGEGAKQIGCIASQGPRQGVFNLTKVMILSKVTLDQGVDINVLNTVLFLASKFIFSFCFSYLV